MCFTAFSFGYTANLNMHNLSGNYRDLSKQTTTQPIISFVIEDYQQIPVAKNDSENLLSLYAVWLRSIFHCYLLTFAKPFRWQYSDYWRMRSSKKNQNEEYIRTQIRLKVAIYDENVSPCEAD